MTTNENADASDDVELTVEQSYIHSLEGENARLKRENAGLKACSGEVLQELAEKSSEIANLKRENVGLKARSDGRGVVIDSLRNQIEEMANTDAVQRELGSENARLKRENAATSESVAGDGDPSREAEPPVNVDIGDADADQQHEAHGGISLREGRRGVKALLEAFEIDEESEVLAEEVRNVLGSVMDAAPNTVELGGMIRLAFGDGVKRGVKSKDAHGRQPPVWLGLRAKAAGTEDNPHEHDGETFTWSPRDVARRFADIVPIEAVQQRLDDLEAKLSGFQNDPPGDATADQQHGGTDVVERGELKRQRLVERAVKALREAFEGNHDSEVLSEEVRNMLATIMDSVPKIVQLGLQAKASGTDDNPHEYNAGTPIKAEPLVNADMDALATRLADVEERIANRVSEGNIAWERINGRLDALEAKLSDPLAVGGIERGVKD